MLSSGTDHIRAVAERLLGEAVTLVPGGQGGNNRLWRAEGARGVWAVKCYFRHPSDTRDRLGAEFDALRFLTERGETAIAHAVAADRTEGVAIYSWIDGNSVEPRRPGDLEDMAAFLGRLHAVSPQGGGLPLASEACLSGAELSRQLTSRLNRLTEGAPQDIPALRTLLSEDLPDALDTATRRARTLLSTDGQDFDSDLSVARRTLSSSDFGTHNALRRPDGSLAYVDFEYFGWDDPVKLVADTLLHPAMTLDEAERARFHGLACDIYRADGGFDLRLAAFHPLYALRWAFIVLNPFLPERWARTAFATDAEREALLHDRLRKARIFLKIARTTSR